MKTAIRVLGAIVWPPRAPSGDGPSHSNHAWWVAVCIATVMPVTAVLHHGVFYRFNCMLQGFGHDYTPGVTAAWLVRDPSLACALVAMVTMYWIGRRRPGVQVLMAPIFASFLPLSLWIWDIPFSGRFIHRHFHDGRILVAAGWPLTARYFYVLGLALYLSFLASIVRKMGKSK